MALARSVRPSSRAFALPNALVGLFMLVFFGLANGATAQTLPNITSHSLALHLQANASSVAVDGNGDVLSWTAENDPSIVFTRDAGFTPNEIKLDLTGMYGQPTVNVTNLGGNPNMETTLPASLDLMDATIFWLGFYRNSSPGGEYLYTIGTGSAGGTYSHQQDGGRVEIYNGFTYSGDPIVQYRGVYTVWTTEYFSGSPAVNHNAYADGVNLNVSSSTVGYNAAPDPHPMSLFAFRGNGFHFEGEVAEILIYDGILSPSEIDAIEAYLRARAGEPPLIDLTAGEVIQYEFGCQEDANWIASPSGRTINQLNNSDATIFLTDEESSGQVISGRLGAAFAPDFMGFVFGYQDRSRYYLFDWKRVAASWCGGVADAGMRLRVVDYPAGVDPSGAELWSDSSANITIMEKNLIPWLPDTDYEFELEFDAGQIEISIFEPTGALVESWSVADSTFSDGAFGLYTNSLQNVAFGPFFSVPEPSFGGMLGIGALMLAWRSRRRCCARAFRG